MVPLKYSNNFWRTLQIPLISGRINLILSWTANCVIVSPDVANQGATFVITETKLYIFVGHLLTQDNAKLLQQRKPSLKGTISCNKYTKRKLEPFT